MTEAIDRHWMARALSLADIALGTTAPNPPVGALVVRDGSVLGQGWTHPPGGPHAEVAALRDCAARGLDPAGATMYVTLEPCCHHGKTPPCTDALQQAGIARVVVGVLDPFPVMQGRSVALLREAGLEVRLGIEEEAAARRILGFARSVAVGLPEVTAKAAISADGHIATATGESQWISGPQARQHGHILRARHDAILVGIGTALADDPRLTTRLPPGVLPGPQIPRDPVPVVLDTHLRLPAEARLLQGGRAVVVCGPEAPRRQLPAEIVRVPQRPGGGLDPGAVLAALAQRGLHRVLVEGGGQIHRALLDARLVDTLELYLAPTLLPGGRPWVGGPPVEALEQGISMELVEVERLGPDVRLSFRLEHGTAPDPLSTLRSTLPTR